MKVVRIVIGFVFFAVLITIQAPDAQGQDRFSTMESCAEAMKAGTAVWYQPSFFTNARLAPRRPVSSTHPLEDRACVEMIIVGGGYSWVPQPGTPQAAAAGMLAPTFDFDAAGDPIRRTDCGNLVRRIVYIPIPASPVQPQRPVRPPPPPPPTRVNASPFCVTEGNPKDGFVGTAYNGRGTWLFKDSSGLELGTVGDFYYPSSKNLKPGKYQVTYRVIGDDGTTAECPRQWEVFPLPTPIVAEEEEAGYCDEGNDHHKIAWPWVQLRCHPVRTALIVGAGVCVATAIYSKVENEKVLPCGWFVKKGFKIINEPGHAPGGVIPPGL